MTGSDCAVDDQLAALESQQEELLLSTFTNEDAWRLGSWLWSTARERGYRIVITIVRDEQIVFAAALPGSSADLSAWAERKVRTVRRFASSSYLVGRRLQQKGQGLDHYGLSTKEYATLGGAVPLMVSEMGMIGVVGVSGMPEAVDHELVVEGIRQLQVWQEVR